jgi:hypothetical protein
MMRGAMTLLGNVTFLRGEAIQVAASYVEQNVAASPVRVNRDTRLLPREGVSSRRQEPRWTSSAAIFEG